jgi:uncharacterized membrane protein
MRLHEIHPALVHLPIALLPASLAADAAGMRDAGRAGIAITAGSAALAAASGLIAQEEVQTDEVSHDLLATHRTLNLGVLGATVAMAFHRAGRERPGAGYLAFGLAALGVTLYSAYLGGRMVYAHGVGVEPAGGLEPDHAPPVEGMSAGGLLRRIGADLRQGLQHTFEHLREGDVVPALTAPPDDTKT